MTADTDKPKALRCIIAGGRFYRLTKRDEERLDDLPIGEVVSGGSPGADWDGEFWAKSRGVPVRIFPAEWARHGYSAGPIRNRQMAEYADAVALFPGGRGTESMFNEAKRAGIQIFDFRE